MYDTQYDQKCETVYETKYDTVHEQKCETKYQTEYSEKCETKYDTEYDTQVSREIFSTLLQLFLKEKRPNYHFPFPSNFFPHLANGSACTFEIIRRGGRSFLSFSPGN